MKSVDHTHIAHYKKLGVSPIIILSKIACSSTSPLIKRIITLLKKGKHMQALELTSAFSPSSYDDVDQLRFDWSIIQSVQKAEWLTLDIDPVAVAINGFRENEKHCGLINRTFDERKQTIGFEQHSAVTNVVSDILGDLDYEELLRSCSFTNGASALLTKSKSSSYNKILLPTEVTPDCHELVRLVKSYMIHLYDGVDSINIWDQLSPTSKIVQGNYITTVPKNAKTDRTIAKEPAGNMMLQRATGKCISRRLTHTGNDIPSGADRAKKLARIGSLDSSLVTIDLKAASDSISYALVESLLPTQWRLLLEHTRSPRYNIDGKWYDFNKWSSMGNGYTFELETLIFLSIVRSIVPKDEWCKCNVFGDDIICPTEYAAPVIKLLADYGFITNVDKTFTEGFFRESCGGHYLHGFEVTPLTLKVALTTTDDHILIANKLRRYNASIGIMDPRLYGAYEYLINEIKGNDPFWAVPRIPDQQGDGALIGSLAEVLPRYKHGFFLTKTRTWRQKRCRFTDEVHNIMWAMSSSDMTCCHSSDWSYQSRGKLSLSTTKLRVSEWLDPPMMIPYPTTQEYLN